MSPLVARGSKLLLLAIVLSAGPSAMAQNWVGLRIMPKADTTLLMVGGQVVGDVTSIHWPATVEKVNGTWLWVADDGSTSHPRVAGWIRDSDVLQMSAALDYFNDRLLDGNDTAGMYWLRGICWESVGDFQLARMDYDTAVKKSPGHPHAHLGLARALAKTGSDPKEVMATFAAAKRVNPSHPRLHWDWGQAIEATDHEGARQHYTTAAGLSPHWWQPYYSLGILAGEQGDYPTSMANLNEAIRRNPWSYYAYRDRAKYQLAHLEKTTKDPSAADLNSVLVSAGKACELSYYRNCESLEVLASTFAALKNYKVAKHYQQLAVEQAPLPSKAKHLKKWQEYDSAAGETLLASDTPSASASGSQTRTRDITGVLGTPDSQPSAGPAAPQPEQPIFIDRSGFSVP